ncbi:uncharacterized protein FA14DRAFT_160405 [Meira miltonrushii]|uniref:Uncharacterized protein n=1 Tax=Meira miltonrushii TaxID=1280837 RepID=A0A316VFK8_9BASI|nr:uncharacterized protein FA14DRAFT_160405 [Meira miltonrushii]PWN35103.1 hypothetical protein FA14DRAFT_160405 [Meira miltonrushii]
MSKAATMKPSRGLGLGGGWLSMAPQTDNTPYRPQPVAIVDEQRETNQQPPSGPSSDQNSPVIPPHRSKHGGLQPQPSSSSSSHAIKAESVHAKQELVSPQSQSTGPSALPRRLIPRTNARFSVGDSTSQPATPASPAPSSPPLSPGSGDGDQSPAAFDVRDSFAPMQWSKAVGSTVPSSSRRTSQTDGEGKSGNRLQQGQRTGMVAKHKADVIVEDHDDESDGERVEYAGRKWRGKTANAIEQEMEALGDRTVMSYAPDAVYLASRLEGLRRNLEAGGDRFRRWAWEDYDQIEAHGDIDGDHEMEGTDVVIASAAKKLSQEVESQSVNALRHSSAQASYHASPARSALLSSSILSPVQEVPADPMSTSSVQYGQDIAQAGPSHTAAGDVDRAAKEAALDARVEIRTLRRPDLEQVRELHCYHGDGDKVSNSFVFSFPLFPCFLLFLHIIKTTGYWFPYEVSIVLEYPW